MRLLSRFECAASKSVLVSAPAVGLSWRGSRTPLTVIEHRGPILDLHLSEAVDDTGYLAIRAGRFSDEIAHPVFTKQQRVDRHLDVQ